MKSSLLFSLAMLNIASGAVAAQHDTLTVVASHFQAGSKMSVTDSAGNTLTYVLKERDYYPLSQQHVRQDKKLAKVGPSLDKPYYQVRMALPIPSSYTPTEQGAMVGLDEGVYHHLHSAGLEALPNGDMLAIYFSTPKGKAEKDTATTFIQCRRRAGNEYWDMPELFFDTRCGNDQSALLHRDGDRIWFFGGGRDMSDLVPFRVCYSDDNGATWTYQVPELDAPAQDFTAQPISNAFRDPAGNLYFAMDAAGSRSFLWRSADNGKSWHDMGGRTDCRHSSIIPLDDQGNLLSVGGKNNNANGWNPMNLSHDWGKTWEPATTGFLPQLGSAQRPCVIRLQSGALFLATDAYLLKHKIAPPEDWKHGYDCVAGISTDNGKTWHFRTLPGTLPWHRPSGYTALGYVTVRQSDNGMIHILTTTNYPSIEIELNEAWMWSEEGDLSYDQCPKPKLGKGWKIIDKKNHLATWTQYWPNGKKRVVSTWRYWTTPRDGKHVLTGRIAHGPARHYDEQGNLTAEYNFIDGALDGIDELEARRREEAAKQ